MPRIKDYDMGLRKYTRVATSAQQLQHNRSFRHSRNNQGMPITALILKKPTEAHKPLSKQEAPAINKALDTHAT